MIPHELAIDYYALVGTIAAHEIHMSDAKASELAEVIINAGFRWAEQERN